MQPSGPQHLSAAQPSSPRDRRAVRRAIEHWLRNTWSADSIPLLDTFDFSPMRGDWGQRFLICGVMRSRMLFSDISAGAEVTPD